MTASKTAKSLGCKDLEQVIQATDTSRQTLQNWHKNKPKLFRIVCIGTAQDLVSEQEKSDVQPKKVNS